MQSVELQLLIQMEILQQLQGSLKTKTARHIHTTHGPRTGQVGSCQTVACTGTSGQPTASSVAGVYIGMDSAAAGGF